MIEIGAEDERRAGFVMELRRRGVRDLAVLVAMERVPRLGFVPIEVAEHAGDDRPLPLACGQTMERPSVAAKWLEALAIKPGMNVLEIGTGSGWLTAVMARLGARVTSLERYRTLHQAAAGRLEALNLGAQAQLRRADGLLGARDRAPFDRILVSGAVEALPQPLIDQLAEGGLLLAPLGPAAGPQVLTRRERRLGGDIESPLGTVRVTPLQPGLARAT